MEEKLNFQEINSNGRINFLNKNHFWLSYVIVIETAVIYYEMKSIGK